MYLSDLKSVFQSRSVFQSNLKWDGGVLKLQKIKWIMPTLPTLNLLLLKVLFHG